MVGYRVKLCGQLDSVHSVNTDSLTIHGLTTKHMCTPHPELTKDATS